MERFLKDRIVVLSQGDVPGGRVVNVGNVPDDSLAVSVAREMAADRQDAVVVTNLDTPKTSDSPSPGVVVEDLGKPLQ